MFTEIINLVAFLVENCTGVVLTEIRANHTTQASADSEAPLLENELANPLEDFTSLDPEDVIFQEFEPPRHLQSDPKAWKQSLPTFKKSLWDCLKTVLLIQGLAATLTGFIGAIVVYLDFKTADWCYDEVWNKTPKDVQHLKVTVKCVECFFLQLWSFFGLCIMVPYPLVKKLNLILLSLVAGFMDVVFRLYLLMYGINIFKTPWMAIPLNGIFGVVIITNHFRIARHFYPSSLKNTFKLHFVMTSPFFLGIPVWYCLVYKLFPFYLQQDEQTKILIASFYPLLILIPKAVSRVGAQSPILKGVLHPGNAHALVAITYGVSAVVFRVLQAQLTNLDLFIALGIAHAIIDLLERFTITMRDHIWEYLYRLVRRQRGRQPKYRSPRSRRLIADLSIQIMLQEVSGLMIALGFINVYQLIFANPKSFTIHQFVRTFLIRASISLGIDMVFNTLSVLIQTRVINLAVNRVWRKKWRRHLVANSLIVCISVLFFSEHLFQIVRDKYISKHLDIHEPNCSFPSFL